ncbi:MAG: alpha/beta fold hydrolase [Erythrobacter sp.]
MKRKITTALAAIGLATAAPALAEAVTVAGPQGDLAGTLVMPQDGKPLVLIIPGSGPTDRDGNNPIGVSASTYRLLAEGLAERGIGSLRSDKRGMFASKEAIADPNEVTIGAYVDDVAAWSALARERTGNDCVWLLGHSEGGIVALAAANRLDRLCGIILAAAPGRPLGTILREQLHANPANAPIWEQSDAAIDKLEAGERVDTSDMHPGLAPLFGPQVQGFLIDVMAHEPAKLLAGTDLPVLVVQGGKDLQIPRADAEALVAAREITEMVEFADMNHVLKDVESDDRMANIAVYSKPDLALTSGLVDYLVGFMEEQR